MTTTIQRVRELQEQIRASEAKLLELTQQPEYLAEQQFIQDILDVLEIHSRTLREAVLAIDPTLLAPTPKPKQVRGAYKKQDKPKPFTLDEKPAGGPPAPKPSPFATFGQDAAPMSPADHPLEPEAATVATKPAKPAKKSKKPQRASHNAARNAARRIECIKSGTWFMYTNPHTQETEEASGTRTDTLRAWVAEFGKGAVESWKRPITPDEAGL